VITIFAVLVGLSAWGVLGGLLGVPVAAAINVTLHVLYPEETGNQGDRRAFDMAVGPGATADASQDEVRGVSPTPTGDIPAVDG